MMYIGYKNYSELTSNIFLLGQEAVCVGIKGGLRDFDSVITSYRAHGFAYVMGISVLGVLSELTGKVSGCVRGKVTFCNVVANIFNFLFYQWTIITMLSICREVQCICMLQISMGVMELSEPRCH